MAVITSDMLQELNLDDVDENSTLVSSLLDDSKALILDSLGLTDDSTLIGSKLYDRCIKAITTEMYFDRTLSTGLSNGVMLLLIHLKGQVLPNVSTS
ncbi:hypothetical protein [Liquorilactobacillus uvarum]|uniref:hypothetical protein n=1 Tax=Liquorilactobacillus uvarum TaxID=303240 RepID=UPI00288B49E0|nr:hypothetical protein [Liquorilactobacillus uvarum]